MRSAAPEGVSARRSAVKSVRTWSISCPIAEIVGIGAMSHGPGEGFFIEGPEVFDAAAAAG